VDPAGFGAGDTNLYRTEGNGPVGNTDPSGLAVGHHWVPVSVLEQFVDLLSKDAIDLAMGAVSGETEPTHGFKRYGGVSHKEYTDLVKDQLEKYVKANGISAENKMTANQMQEFAERMRDGKLHDGSNPRFLSKFKKLKKFNDAIKAERETFEAGSKGRAKPLDSSAEANQKRGKWYRGQSGRFGAALLMSLLFEVADGSVAIANTAVDPGEGKRHYFREAIEALTKGDLYAANKAMVGDDTEGGLGGFVGQINDAGNAKPAIWFAGWWSEKHTQALERERKLGLRP